MRGNEGGDMASSTDFRQEKRPKGFEIFGSKNIRKKRKRILVVGGFNVVVIGCRR